MGTCVSAAFACVMFDYTSSYVGSYTCVKGIVNATDYVDMPHMLAILYVCPSTRTFVVRLGRLRRPRSPQCLNKKPPCKERFFLFKYWYPAEDSPTTLGGASLRRLPSRPDVRSSTYGLFLPAVGGRSLLVLCWRNSKEEVPRRGLEPLTAALKGRCSAR